MELKDTVKPMLSDDWRDRLLAEWMQVCIRYRKLTEFLIAADRGHRKYKSNRDKFHLKKQKEAMSRYIIALEARMKDAGIEFEAYKY